MDRQDRQSTQTDVTVRGLYLGPLPPHHHLLYGSLHSLRLWTNWQGRQAGQTDRTGQTGKADGQDRQTTQMDMTEDCTWILFLLISVSYLEVYVAFASVQTGKADGQDRWTGQDRTDWQGRQTGQTDNTDRQDSKRTVPGSSSSSSPSPIRKST